MLFVNKILEEVLEEHLTNCSELDVGSEHQLEISEGRVVKIKIAFRLFTKVRNIDASQKEYLYSFIRTKILIT